MDLPGCRTAALRYVTDGERLLCLGDDGLADVANGTRLFASVRGLACGPLEHEQAGELLARLRQVTAGYAVPEDGCASYRALYTRLEHLEADTHVHIHKENNVLFPTAVALEVSAAM